MTLCRLLLLCALCVVVEVVQAVPIQESGKEEATLILLDDESARCMDGSKSGYYYRKHSSIHAEGNFVISLEGGGECGTEGDCVARSKTDLGSSKKWPNATMLYQLQDADCTINPTYCAWTQVFVKYCSGDVHSGTRGTPSAESFNLIFAGHNIVKAVIEDLKSRANIHRAQTVVFSGDSAGGIGTFINVDFVADALPGVKVVGAPIAGFYFLNYFYTGEGQVPGGVPFTPDAWPVYIKLWQSFLPVRCVAAQIAGEEWKCMMANYSYETMRTRMFIMEAQTDKVQMELHDHVPSAKPIIPPVMDFITKWGKNMTSALAKALEARPDFGLFSPACYMHTEFGATQPMIQGYNIFQALAEWMSEIHGHIPRVLTDDCGVMCNPTCPGV